MNEKRYRIAGRVTERQTARGVEGLRVEAWDKDLICDDLVGSAVTDEQGGFRIEFDESYFRDLFLDRRPDLYFKVFHGEELIKSTEDSVLWNIEAADTEVSIQVDGPWLLLNREARLRCGPGISRLLRMSDEQILVEKQRDEERVRKQEAEAARGDEPQAAAIRLRRQVMPDPALSAVAVFQRPFFELRIRALTEFAGNAADLEAMGIRVQSAVHDVFTIEATKAQLATLALQAATRKIRLPRRFQLHLDDAIPTAEVDQIHALGTEGAGVIVGVIDSGLNVRHHGFRDPVTQNTRVQYLWVQKPLAGAAGTAPEAYFAAQYPAPAVNPFQGLTYGILYDQAAIDAAIALANSFGTGAGQIAITPTDNDGHGTHVCGIAAGNGRDLNWNQGVNVGAAPAADIVFVANDLDESRALDAMRFVFEIANRQNQPAVVNVSIGSFAGPRDGQSSYDQAQDAVLNSFHRRALVRAAGNDNVYPAFREATVPASQTEAAWTLNPGTWALMDLWSTGPELDIRLSCGAGTSGWINAGNEFHGTVAASAANIYTLHVDRDVETRTGLHNLQIWIPAAGPENWSVELRNPGASDAGYWAWSGWSAGLANPVFDRLTLADTACCKSVLTAGACAQQVGGNPELIANYSGCGPTLDGRIKPEITAVGGIPAAPVQSCDAATDGGYKGMQGTSMSSPLIAGSIALLFQNEPDLNQDAIKALLIQTADRTGLNIDPGVAGYDPTERNQYGYGRLRMLAPFQHSLPLRDVDVFVRTASDDYGEEPYPGECFCGAPEVQVLDANGQDATQLQWGSEYTVKVRVHNLGDTPAVQTKVRIKYTRPWTAPDDWTPCRDATAAHDPIEQQINVPALDYYDLTFTQRWKPVAGEVPATGTDWGDHHCLLVELNDVSHPDDPLQYDDSTADGRDPWTRNIKGSNNVALRNLAIQ